jgi:ABC-type proline/glycine betaine transport system permease subunit
MVGVVMSVFLAVVLDFILVFIEWLLTPWARRRTAP